MVAVNKIMCYDGNMNKDVIYIEPEDDITDIITKIEKSKEKTVYITQISSTTLNKRNISKNIYL